MCCGRWIEKEREIDKESEKKKTRVSNELRAPDSPIHPSGRSSGGLAPPVRYSGGSQVVSTGPQKNDDDNSDCSDGSDGDADDETSDSGGEADDETFDDDDTTKIEIPSVNNPSCQSATHFDLAHRRRRARSKALREGACKQPVGRPRQELPSDAAVKKRKYRAKKVVQKAMTELLRVNPGAEEIIKQAIQLPAFADLAEGHMVVKGVTDVLRKQHDENLSSQSTQAGRACRGTLVGLIANSVTATHLSKAVQGAVPAGYVRKQKARLEKLGFNDLLKLKCEKLSRMKISSEERKMYVDFFEKHTVVFSGAASETKHLLLPLHELEIVLYAEFPAMLRCGWKDRPPEGTNSFTRAIRSAWDVGNQPGFNEDNEFKQRYDEATSKYHQHLAAKVVENQVEVLVLCGDCGEDRAKSPVVPCVNLHANQDEEEDSDIDHEQADSLKNNLMKPRGMRVFWRIISEAKINWSTASNPHPCPIHEKGPAQVQALLTLQEQQKATVLKQAAYQSESAEWECCRKEIHTRELRMSALRKEVDIFRLHEDQFKNCRPYVTQIQKKLKDGECVVYRDFVNQYGDGGGKVANLVLVRIAKVNGVRTVVKTSHICNDPNSRSTDSYYVADVFAYHMAHADPGLFADFHTIYLVGDHGPHFSSNDTIRNEASFFKKYNKTLHLIFLCSYHAYNRCDAAGAQLMRVLEANTKMDKRERTAKEVARVMNSANFKDHKAVPFEMICRNKDTFLPNTKNLPNIKKICEVIFCFKDENGDIAREDDIVLFRNVPGQGLFTVWDMNAKSKIKLCDICSNHHQRPIRHVAKQQCTFKQMELLDNRGYSDSSRATGLQINKKTKGKIGLAFPCKLDGCGLSYQKYTGANAHMRKTHAAQIFDIVLYNKNDPPANLNNQLELPQPPAQLEQQPAQRGKKKRKPVPGKNDPPVTVSLDHQQEPPHQTAQLEQQSHALMSKPRKRKGIENSKESSSLETQKQQKRQNQSKKKREKGETEPENDSDIVVGESAVRRSERCNDRRRPNYVEESGEEHEDDNDEEYVEETEEDEEDEKEADEGDEGEEEDEQPEDEPDEDAPRGAEPEKKDSNSVVESASVAPISTTVRSSTSTVPSTVPAKTTNSTPQFQRTFFCDFCGEKFQQQEKFKQHKEQELAELHASLEAHPFIMPAPSRSQLPSTSTSSNMVGTQDHPVCVVSASFAAGCASPPTRFTTATTSSTATPKTTSSTSFVRTFFCPYCGEVFHQLECFKQHKEKELAKQKAVSAASAAASSASAAVKSAELARDFSAKASVSAAASAAVAARVKGFSAKAISLSLLPVPSVSGVFHQLERFKQHQEKELAKQKAVSAASAAASSASAAVKSAELARDFSAKASVSAATSAAVAARAKDFSAKAISLSLDPGPSVSGASSSFPSDSSTSEYPAATSDAFGPTSTDTSVGSATVL